MKFDNYGNIILTLTANEAHSLAMLIGDGTEFMDERIERDEKSREDLHCYTDDEVSTMRQMIEVGKRFVTALDGMVALAQTNGTGSWVTNLPGLLDTIHRLVSLTNQEKFNQIEREQLLARFPWLDTDEEISGAAAVDGLLDWYHSLTPGAERNGTG